MKRYSNLIFILVISALLLFIEAFSLSLSLVKVSNVYAANRTTIGTLKLTPTFESIGVQCDFSDDDNENMTASLQYRITGTGTWIDAHTPWVDRRDQAYDSGWKPNPLENTVRGSIFYLDRNTSYDVRLNFTDLDGFTGSDTISEIVTTWSHDQPTYGGDIITVCPSGCDFTTIQASINDSATGPGDIIQVKSGTYSGFTISKNGTLGAYIKIEAFNSGNMPTINSLITMQGNYVELSYLDVTADITLSSTAQYNIIRNCTIDDTNSSHGTYARIFLNTDVTGLLIEDNTITGMASGTPNDEHETAIYMKNIWGDPTKNPPNTSAMAGGVVVRNNTITAVWDGVGTEANTQFSSGFRNTDIYGNDVSNCSDDCLETEGAEINVRVWGNYLHNSSTDAIGVAGVVLGPQYNFNNIFYDVDDYAIKHGYSDGKTYFYFNTFWSVRQGSADTNSPRAGNFTWKNNIYKTIYYIYENYSGAGWVTDYNNWDSTGSQSSKWGGTTRSTLAALQSAESTQEINTIRVDSKLVNPPTDFSLQSDSTLIDAGTSITGITKDYVGNPRTFGSAPDIGAHEYTGRPNPPTSLRIIQSGN